MEWWVLVVERVVGGGAAVGYFGSLCQWRERERARETRLAASFSLRFCFSFFFFGREISGFHFGRSGFFPFFFFWSEVDNS